MRIPWIDNLKTVGIFCVVYGHTLGIIVSIGVWIYSFHIPLFFLVSGYLLKSKYLEKDFKAFFIKTTKSIIPPYIIFSIIGYLFWLLISRHFGNDAGQAMNVFEPLFAILYGTSSHDSIQLTPIVLWFFPCLYVAQLLTYWVFRPAKLIIVLLFSIALMIVGVLIPHNIFLPFELEDALIAQFFVTLGCIAKKKNIMGYLCTHKSYIWALLLIATGSIASYMNGRVDMRSAYYGNVLYFLCSSIGITMGIAIICSKFPATKLSENISENTVMIFPLHFLVFSCFSAIYVYGFHNLEIREMPSVSLIAAIANILLLITISPIIKKVLPWAYGIKSGTISN